ncbi:MAG TPA: hypothetical protein VFM15_05085, partial [Gammaproteobacteria bacterium]|nr:hypothetical protein [Gammaproteobacteria bacterium]
MKVQTKNNCNRYGVPGMKAMLARSLGIVFAGIALLILVTWLADGAPLPRPWDMGFVSKIQGDKVFMNVSLSGNMSHAGQLLKAITAAGYSAVDVTEGTWVSDYHVFVIPKPLDSQEAQALKSRLSGELPTGITQETRVY